MLQSFKTDEENDSKRSTTAAKLLTQELSVLKESSARDREELQAEVEVLRGQVGRLVQRFALREEETEGEGVHASVASIGRLSD